MIQDKALRQAFESADFEAYTALCGKPYTLSGTIEHGRALGRTVGMPTANLHVDAGEMLPPSGVYATITHLPEGKFMGLTNIGPRPSVDDSGRVTVETYLFDFSRDIYGERCTLEIHFRIRGIQKFPNLDAVQAQVRRDKAAAREKLMYIYAEEG